MHRLVGKGIAWLGGLILLSAVAVNPWIGTYYQDHIENYADVMLNYVWWSLGLAGLLVGVGLMAAKRKSEGWTGAAMLLATVSLIVLADRALLVYFGLPYTPDDQRGGGGLCDQSRIRDVAPIAGLCPGLSADCLE